MTNSPRLPRSPFSTRLSGSAGETELRIRSIFQSQKKRPPLWLMALTALAILSCGGLVSCEGHTAEGASLQSESTSPEPDGRLESSVDLNHNGIPEEVRLVDAYGAQEVQFWENGQLIDREVPGIYLCTLDGTDYILRLTLNEYQGNFQYHYELADLSGEFEETVRWDEIRFDTNFRALYHKSFDPEAIAAFVEDLDGLLAHSIQLSERDGALLSEPAPAVELNWLGDVPDLFAPDAGTSLAGNLTAFQEAVTQAMGPLAPLGETRSLPIEQAVQLIFSSGAGAWSTDLELRPDGSFTGDYHDADGTTVYVCQFHGTFREFIQLTSSSWLLTLDELVLDTGHPVGTEWDQQSWHYISSTPNGFTDETGNVLSPGAQFVLYTPDAQGHAPGTELYGAYDFWSWWPNRHTFHSSSDTLDCYGLYNLEGEIGFFS